MKVLLYTEGYKTVAKSGLGKAIKHQMQALDYENIEYTLDPKDDYDIMHINTWWLKSYFMAKKAKKMGKKVVYHAHSTEEDYKNGFKLAKQTSKLVKWWLIKCYSLGDVIVTPTPYSKKLLSHYKGLEHKKIYAISNGIDLSLFKKDKKAGEKFRKEYGYKKDDKVIIGIGLYIERKGIVDFVELAKRMPEYKFIWFGYSPLAAATKPVRKAVNTKLPNLTFAGYVEQDMIKAALNGCDLYLFPTFEETEGIPIIEACAVGANAIIRDIKIFDDWLVDGKTVYKAKNVDDFEIKIKKIFNGKLKSVADNAYDVAKKRDIKEIGKELKAVYQKVMKMDNSDFIKKERIKKRNIALIFTSVLLLIAMFLGKDKFEFTKNEYSKTINNYNIKIYTQSKKKADKTFKELEIINNKYNEYLLETNFIYENKDTSDTLTLSADLYDFLYDLDKYYQDNPNLDIYLGNYYDAYYLARENNIVPNYELVNSNINKIEFLGNNKIKNNHSNIYLENIIDGYILSDMIKYLEDNKIDTYLITSNSLVVAGKNVKKKEKYLIAISSPVKDDEGMIQVVKFNNKAMATKGIYQNSYQVDGINYSSIISPKTLNSANNMISVTVITTDPKNAQLKALELFLMGIEEGQELVENDADLEALWCYYLEDLKYKCIRSDGFDNNI